MVIGSLNRIEWAYVDIPKQWIPRQVDMFRRRWMCDWLVRPVMDNEYWSVTLLRFFLSNWGWKYQAIGRIYTVAVAMMFSYRCRSWEMSVLMRSILVSNGYRRVWVCKLQVVYVLTVQCFSCWLRLHSGCLMLSMMVVCSGLSHSLISIKWKWPAVPGGV